MDVATKKERPILFSGPMVRALLDGSKTQTRRVVKRQPPADVASIRVSHYHPTVIDRRGDEQPGAEIFGAYSDDGEWGSKFPYGEPGDRLWVRETFRDYTEHELGLAYRADWPDENIKRQWIPSIHMPRWASRISLEVTAVRVERLQDISRGDAMDEGCPFPNMATGDDPRTWFSDLWSQINGAASWDANPWVWVVEFKRIEA